MRTSSNPYLRFKSIKKLKPIKKKKLYEDIVIQIERLIKKGGLRPGDQLPSERELANSFKVSRNSVREAIRTLEEKGLLKSKCGDGTYLMPDNANLIVRPLAMAIHREKTNLSDIFQFRRLIEPLIASLAAENASAKEIEDLESVLHDHKVNINNERAVKQLDSSFHLLLARASGNMIFLRIVDALNDILSETREETLQFEERRIKSFEGHSAILKAIKEKETRVARKAMANHLRDVEKIIINSNPSISKSRPERKVHVESIK